VRRAAEREVRTSHLALVFWIYMCFGKKALTQPMACCAQEAERAAARAAEEAARRAQAEAERARLAEEQRRLREEDRKRRGIASVSARFKGEIAVGCIYGALYEASASSDCTFKLVAHRL